MISSKKYLLKDLITWFEDLKELARNTNNDSSLPKLELFLSNGQTIKGSIIESIKNNQEYLLMIMEFSNQNSESNITLIGSSQIIGLRLIEVNNYIRLFATSKTPEIIGSLQFKRSVSDIQDELNKTTSTPIIIILDVDSYVENERYLILKVLKLIPPIFSSLTSDNIGKELVSKKIKNITISIGTGDNPTLIEQNLHLKVSDSGFITTSKETEKLKTAIENLL